MERDADTSLEVPATGGLWGREERRGDRKSWAGGSLGAGGTEVRLGGRQTGEGLKWAGAAGLPAGAQSIDR